MKETVGFGFRNKQLDVCAVENVKRNTLVYIGRGIESDENVLSSSIFPGENLAHVRMIFHDTRFKMIFEESPFQDVPASDEQVTGNHRFQTVRQVYRPKPFLHSNTATRFTFDRFHVTLVFRPFVKRRHDETMLTSHKFAIFLDVSFVLCESHDLGTSLAFHVCQLAFCFDVIALISGHTCPSTFQDTLRLETEDLFDYCLVCRVVKRSGATATIWTRVDDAIYSGPFYRVSTQIANNSPATVKLKRTKRNFQTNDARQIVFSIVSDWVQFETVVVFEM